MKITMRQRSWCYSIVLMARRFKHTQGHSTIGSQSCKVGTATGSGIILLFLILFLTISAISLGAKSLESPGQVSIVCWVMLCPTLLLRVSGWCFSLMLSVCGTAYFKNNKKSSLQHVAFNGKLFRGNVMYSFFFLNARRCRLAPFNSKTH